MTKEEIKLQILKDRLRNIFFKKPDSVAKILKHLSKKAQKNV